MDFKKKKSSIMSLMYNFASSMSLMNPDWERDVWKVDLNIKIYRQDMITSHLNKAIYYKNKSINRDGKLANIKEPDKCSIKSKIVLSNNNDSKIDSYSVASNSFKERNSTAPINIKTRIQTQSQHLDKRNNSLWKKVHNNQILYNNARRSDYFCVVENDWKTNSNFINEINTLQNEANYSSNNITDNNINKNRIMKNISIRGQSMPRGHPEGKVEFRKNMNSQL